MIRLRRALAELRRHRHDAAAARRNRGAASRCFYCGVDFEAGGSSARTVDHRLARSRGGTDGLANLVFACRACNDRKADRPEAAFVASSWLEERRRAVEGARAPGT